MMKQPTISVVMSMYNSAEYLREAIESILSQTFSDFEFIIIDNASTDNSLSIAKSYKDKRLVIIKNEKNIGLPLSLKRGVDLARGTYIVRMDGDDISLPYRFEKQIKYMSENPEIMISGTWAKTVGVKSGYTIKHPTDPDEVKVNLLFRNSLAHPTLIMRREFLVKNNLHYRNSDSNILCAEDFDLYTRAIYFGKISNLNKILLLYRRHEKQMTSEYQETSIFIIKNIIKRQLEYLRIKPTEEDLNIAISVKRYLFLDDNNFPTKLENLFKKIKMANDKSKFYSDIALKKVFGKIWIEVALSFQSQNIDMWNVFWNGLARKWIRFNFRNIVRISKLYLSHIIKLN